MIDVLGQAIFNHFNNTSTKKLWIYNLYGAKEEMPIDIYFRDENDMPEMELFALNICKGNVLDIGAGAGSHALYLQQKSVDITALEISPLASDVMRLRGVKQVVTQDVFLYEEKKFDTLLLLMNGIGLCGNLTGLRKFLQHVKKLMNKGGQLLFDSSDVSYLYDGTVPLTSDYFGEIQYQYQYNKQKTEWFSWLYIDQGTLTQIAFEEGWKTTVLMEDDSDQYLAKLELL